MSLWQIEVEKSKINPATPQKRQLREKLNKFFTPPAPVVPPVNIPPRYQASAESPEQYDRIGVDLYKESVARHYTEKDRRHNQDVHDEQLLAQNLNRLNQELSNDNARLNRQLQMSMQMPSTQKNIDQIAQLIIQRSQMEQDMKSREERYRSLLEESQDLIRQMRTERDAAQSDLKSSRSSHGRSRSGSGTTAHSGSHRSRHQPPPLPPPLPVSLPARPSPPASQTIDRPHYSEDDLEAIFQQHDDMFFKDQFQQLEVNIKQYVLSAMKSQPDKVQYHDLSSSVEYYISTHNLNVSTIFNIRDVRCIVCRGWLIEFLLDKVFRLFLFGISNDSTFKEAFRAISAIDVGHGSKWAASVAKYLIRYSIEYKPEKAAERLVKEIKSHLAPFIDFTDAPEMIKFVLRAAEVARDCRLAYSSFSLELPRYLAPFDPMKMESSSHEQGNVAITYSPIVVQRGNKYGEDYQFIQVLAKGKVWRESIFAELDNLMRGPRDKRERYE